MIRYWKGEKNFVNFPDYIGSNGQLIFLEHDEKIPLIGQISDNQGITILENNMFRSPAYYHSNRNTDFILVRTLNKKGEVSFHTEAYRRVVLHWARRTKNRSISTKVKKFK